MSTGGRFTRPTDVQVAEDGDAEYIIPVKKEGRALPLLRRLLSELSPEARQSLMVTDSVIPTGTEESPGSGAAVSVISTEDAGGVEKSYVPSVLTAEAGVPASSVPVPDLRHAFAEAGRPLASVPAAEREALPSGSAVRQESLSGLVAQLSSALQPSGGSVTNTSNNLSAPVTINVNARGSDAERIGRTIYDTAERYLLRTMKGVFA